jgi:hypothetical protein
MQSNCVQFNGMAKKGIVALDRQKRGKQAAMPQLHQGSAKDIAAACQQAAMQTLIDMLADDSASIRLAAAREVLDRGIGKPTTSVVVAADTGSIGAALLARLASDDSDIAAASAQLAELQATAIAKH